ncbi:hypothetical protein F4825DRAFT_452467 [Nemania diffusa]|nr:hypothetical protein F4825DRAFT_452467 [Nemania diffusa]
MSNQRDEVWGSHPAIRPSVPVLLHVSHETRALALEHYELSFEWKLPRRSEVAAEPARPRQQQQQSDERQQQQRPSSSPLRTWFNFSLDAVYLVGELEPYDAAGASRPMPYFIAARQARRVRKTAVSFAALHYGGVGPQQILGALFHVVDRFAPDAAAEVLVCVTERDEIAHARMGYETWLVDEKYRPRGAAVRRLDADVEPLEIQRPTATALDEENSLRKIWREWYRYSADTWAMGNVQFPLIHESDLAYHVYDFMVTTPSK